MGDSMNPENGSLGREQEAAKFSRRRLLGGVAGALGAAAFGSRISTPDGARAESAPNPAEAVLPQVTVNFLDADEAKSLPPRNHYTAEYNGTPVQLELQPEFTFKPGIDPDTGSPALIFEKKEDNGSTSIVRFYSFELPQGTTIEQYTDQLNASIQKRQAEAQSTDTSLYTPPEADSTTLPWDGPQKGMLNGYNMWGFFPDTDKVTPREFETQYASKGTTVWRLSAEYDGSDGRIGDTAHSNIRLGAETLQIG